MSQNLRMNFSQHEFETIEDGLKVLESATKLRDSMGGAMYHNMLNEDCLRAADKLLALGVEKSKIETMLGNYAYW